ncbi:MAG: hypothetical protein KGM99_12950, partial [Burkholderiales bacterium]|nr:hypothetical protein [Burkholderiales bacterium]
EHLSAQNRNAYSFIAIIFKKISNAAFVSMLMQKWSKKISAAAVQTILADKRLAGVHLETILHQAKFRLVYLLRRTIAV